MTCPLKRAKVNNNLVVRNRKHLVNAMKILCLVFVSVRAIVVAHVMIFLPLVTSLPVCSKKSLVNVMMILWMAFVSVNAEDVAIRGLLSQLLRQQQWYPPLPLPLPRQNLPSL